MIKLKIEGMTCNHCVQAVNQALTGVAGVDRVVEVNLERGEAVVEGIPELADVLTAVEEEGYSARVEEP